jgi:PEP-CTERM motif
MRNFAFAAVAACGLVAASSAGAETLYVSWIGEGQDWSWQQSSTPTPLSYNPAGATDVPVTNFTGGLYSEIIYWPSEEHGGFATPDKAFSTLSVSNLAFYTGPTSNPVFSVGSFSLDDRATGSAAGTITFSATPVPEPSTWGLMLLGFAGLGAIATRKRHAILAA